MNNKKFPMLLLLSLLALSSGLLLLKTVTRNVDNGGLQTIQEKHSEEKELYESVR
jgi:hypothetical protein